MHSDRVGEKRRKDGADEEVRNRWGQGRKEEDGDVKEEKKKEEQKWFLRGEEERKKRKVGKKNENEWSKIILKNKEG